MHKFTQRTVLLIWQHAYDILGTFIFPCCILHFWPYHNEQDSVKEAGEKNNKMGYDQYAVPDTVPVESSIVTLL